MSKSDDTKPHGLLILSITTTLLLIPLIAMQFTDVVSWGPLDFVVMALLLLTAGFAIDVVVRKKLKYRVAVVIGILVALGLLWAELAVGLFTNIGS